MVESVCGLCKGVLLVDCGIEWHSMLARDWHSRSKWVSHGFFLTGCNDLKAQGKCHPRRAGKCTPSGVSFPITTDKPTNNAHQAALNETVQDIVTSSLFTGRSRAGTQGCWVLLPVPPKCKRSRQVTRNWKRLSEGHPKSETSSRPVPHLAPMLVG